MKSNIAAVTTHHLDDAGSLVSRRCISDIGDHGQNSVDRRIEADCVVRVGQIVVYRSRNSHDANAAPRKIQSAAKRPITAHDDHPFDTKGFQYRNSMRLSFFCPESLASRRSENGPAPLQDISH